MRTELLERLGTQITDGSGVTPRPGNALLLASRRGGADATAIWAMTGYEFSHLLPRMARCAMSVYVTPPDVVGVARDARAEVTVDGEIVARLRFGRNAGDFAYRAHRSAPLAVTPEQVPMTPLFNPYGLVFPLADHFCRAGRWDVRLTLHGAEWKVERVGIIARFTPVRPVSNAVPAAIAAAIVVTAAIALAIVLLFEAVARRHGPFALALVLALFLAALVTHDEWDFPVWLRFIDLVAYGHGNPAHMWAGAPLWPFATSLLAPLSIASSALTGNGSAQLAALYLKLAMALAACANALLLARQAPPRLERFLFPVLLLSPLGLYELAGGYRELFAGSLALTGLALALRARYTAGALALSAAAALSESLAPLIFLPMTLRFALRPSDARPSALVVRAALDAAAGVAPLAVLWLFFVPHEMAASVVGLRIAGGYRFGGASWFSSLSGFRVLPPWIAAHSLQTFAVLFIALALPLATSLVREAFVRERHAPERRIVGAFLGFVAAFFIAYRGIDPSTLYTLWAVAAFYFVRFAPANPYPLFFSALGGFAFYTILGIHDFADWNYVMPRNESLLGVLGSPMFVAVLAVQLAVVALYVALLARNDGLLFGRASPGFWLLFSGAAATAAVKMYATDIVFCAAATALLIIACVRFRELCITRLRRSALLDYAGLGAAVTLAASLGNRSGASALVASVGLLLGLAYGFGLCDLIVLASGCLMPAVQAGYGWVSIGGLIILSVSAVFAIHLAYTASLAAMRKTMKAR